MTAGFRLAVKTAIALSFLVGAATAQNTIEDVEALLDIGVSDIEIVQYLDDSGWPSSIVEETLMRVRKLGAGPLLQRHIFARLRRSSDAQRLTEQFQVFDGTINGKSRFSVLRPRGWLVGPMPEKSSRYVFHENDLGGWFRRSSVFLWFFPAENWTRQNEAAITRIAFEAAVQRLVAGGLKSGETSEDQIIHRRSQREFPFLHTLCEDPETKLRGLLGISVHVDESQGFICLLGFVRPVDKKHPIADIKMWLAEMLASLKF